MRTHAQRWLIPILLLAFGATGCAPSIQWRGLLFDPVFHDAQRDKRPTLAYLRAWYLPACTTFENDVLHDPDIVTASRDFYCALLEFDGSRRLAEQWRVEAPPAVVLLDPQGQVLHRLQGQIPKSELLIAMREVARQFAPPATTKPQPAVPKPETKPRPGATPPQEPTAPKPET